MDSINRRDIFYYDSGRMVKFNFSGGLFFGIISFVVFRFHDFTGDRFAFILGPVLLGFSILFFLQALFAFLFQKLPVLEINESAVSIYSGLVGFRKKMVLRRDDLESISIEMREAINYYNVLSRITGNTEIPMLVFRLKEKAGTKQIRVFCSKVFFDFECSADLKEIRLATPPRGGFDPVIAAVSTPIKVA